jgi:hypothetical protein
MLQIFIIKLYIMFLNPYVSTVIFFIIFVKIINNYFFYLNSLNGEAEENILFTSRKKNL